MSSRALQRVCILACMSPLMVAACGIGAAGGSPSPAVSGPASAIATDAPQTPSAVPSVVASGSPSPSRPGSSIAPADLPVCTTSQLAITTTNSSAAAGTVGVYLRFVNRSNQACSLHGWPTVIGVTAGGATLTARDHPVGYLPFPDLPIQTVSLKPGDDAFSSVSGGDNPAGGPGATCPPSYHTLRVTARRHESVVLSAFNTWLGADFTACAGLWASPIVSAAQMNGFIVYPLRP